MYFCLLRLVKIRPVRVIFLCCNVFPLCFVFSNIYRGEISVMFAIEQNN